ncbi:MAG: SDR family NAD(P)-dependent oxidoreductase [Pseudomonadota bacterium]
MAELNCNPNGILKNKTAIVTGASRGIGAAIAQRLAMEGASIIVTARTIDETASRFPGTIHHTVDVINNGGGQAVAIQADLSQPEEREKLITEAQAAMGEIDILVNNAAVTYFVPVVDFTEKHWHLMTEVQIRAPFVLSQFVLPGMIERQSGSILNISSRAAIHPAGPPYQNVRGGSVYGLCKAALERFTTGLASEVHEHNISVNVISPGLVATPGVAHHKLINDNNRHLVEEVEVIAEAALKLVSGDPKTVTGRIDYAGEVLKEFGLEASELLGPTE